MFTVRLSPRDIERVRIEAEYYDPWKLERLSWKAKWRGKLITLDDLCSKITDGTHFTPSYISSGVRFLSSTNIDPFSIDFQDVKFISDEEHSQLGRANCNPQPGDILLAKNGRIGTAALYRLGYERCSLFVSVALLRYNGSLDADYVVAFLNSAGGWYQFSRSSKTGVITNLHLEEIREVEVPDAHGIAQLYIGGKARQAERLRRCAQRFEQRFVDAIAAAFPGLFTPFIGQTKHTRAIVCELDGNLNPGIYNPDRVTIRRYLRDHNGVSMRSVADVVTPTTSTYQLHDRYLGLDGISSHSCMLSCSRIGEEQVEGSVRVLAEGPVISKLRPYLNN